jgi:hypothetical protein
MLGLGPVVQDRFFHLSNRSAHVDPARAGLDAVKDGAVTFVPISRKSTLQARRL